MSSPVELLIGMGFDKGLATIALEEHGGDVQRACFALLGPDSGRAGQPEQQVLVWFAIWSFRGLIHGLFSIRTQAEWTF